MNEIFLCQSKIYVNLCCESVISRRMQPSA